MNRNRFAHLIAMLITTPLAANSFADDLPADALDGHDPIQETALDTVRGFGAGGFVQLNDVDLQATMTGNVIHSSTTGSNIISNGAFTNLEGFATVIQNTGNHVILQNSTIINFMLNE